MVMTPAGHLLQTLWGEAASIADRGAAMTGLGEQMLEAGAILDRFASGEITATGEGKSVERIIASVGSTGADLQMAGDMYVPIGQALTAYAAALEQLQAGVAALVELYESTDAIWIAQYPDMLDAEQEVEAMEPDDPAYPLALERRDELRAAVGVIEDTLDGCMADFDATYERFIDDVYQPALTALQTAQPAGIRDDGWDDVQGFFGTVSSFCSTVGLVTLVGSYIPPTAVPSAVIGTGLGIVGFGAGIGRDVISLAKGEIGWGEAAANTAVGAAGIVPVGKLATTMGVDAARMWLPKLQLHGLTKSVGLSKHAYLPQVTDPRRRDIRTWRDELEQ